MRAGKIGTVHLVAFTLLILSGDRNFGVRLNKSYDHSYPSLKLPAFEGNHADVLILCLHQVIVDGHRNLTQLYDCLLTIIANVAPYIKSISSVTSHKLLSMLRMFTAPKFLLMNPTNCELSLILMDALNNMVQYQFDGNTRLIYAILRNQKLFQAIYDLNLQTALNKLSVTSASESLDSSTSVSQTVANLALDDSAISSGEAAAKAKTSPKLEALKDPQVAPPPASASASASAAATAALISNPLAVPAASSSSKPLPRWIPNEEWVPIFILKIIT